MCCGKGRGACAAVSVLGSDDFGLWNCLGVALCCRSGPHQAIWAATCCKGCARSRACAWDVLRSSVPPRASRAMCILQLGVEGAELEAEPHPFCGFVLHSRTHHIGVAHTRLPCRSVSSSTCSQGRPSRWRRGRWTTAPAGSAAPQAAPRWCSERGWCSGACWPSPTPP